MTFNAVLVKVVTSAAVHDCKFLFYECRQKYYFRKKLLKETLKKYMEYIANQIHNSFHIYKSDLKWSKKWKITLLL